MGCLWTPRSWLLYGNSKNHATQATEKHIIIDPPTEICSNTTMYTKSLKTQHMSLTFKELFSQSLEHHWNATNQYNFHSDNIYYSGPCEFAALMPQHSYKEPPRWEIYRNNKVMSKGFWIGFSQHILQCTCIFLCATPLLWISNCGPTPGLAIIFYLQGQ